MPLISNNTPHPARQQHPGRAITALLLCLVLPTMAAAAEAVDLHAPVTIDPALGWQDLIDQTVQSYPTFIELASRDAEASALLQRGRSWLSGAPAISLRYQSDRSMSAEGLREYEAGLDLPLWRPGQRSTAATLGNAAAGEADAAGRGLRHEIIGLLRTALWDIERAAQARALADAGVGVVESLLNVVERRYEAGELPLTDVLLARNAVMQRQTLLIDSDAALTDAERNYRSLTGLGSRPASFTEALSAREDFDATHPALGLAEAELERARAELALTDASARGAPVLTIGPRREQAALSTQQVDSLGVTLSVPFGGRSQRAVQTSAAARRVAAAEAARGLLLRSLDLNLHEARHSLEVIEASLELVRQRAALAATHLQMSETAFGQGEMTLFELLQQQETARMTQFEAARLEIERQYTIAEINHALGEWP
jgi:cobalt-zinc-cadmium efflux system outer membrane protein